MDKTEIVISAVDHTKSAFESVTRGLSGLEGGLRGIDGIAGRIPLMGAALAAALGSLSFTETIRGMVNMADELNDMSQRTGIAVEKLGAYKLASEQSGASLGAVATGVKGLSAAMQAHGDEFKKLGIDTKDTDKAFRQLADVFKDMPDGMEKSALAVKLFGKSGAELIPMLNLGSEGLERSAQASAAYAETMAAMAPGADKLNDQLAQLSMMSETFGARLALAVVPNLNAAASAFISAEQAGTGFWRALAEGMMAGVSGQGPEETIRGLRKELAAAQEVLKVPDQTTATIELYTQRVDELTKKLKAMNALNPDVKVSGTQSDVRSVDNAIAARANGTAPGLAGKLMDVFDSAGAAKQKSAYEAIAKSLTEKTAALEADAAAMSKLLPAEKEYAVFLAQVTSGVTKLTAEEMKNAAVKWDKYLAAAKLADASEKARKSDEEWTKGVEKANEAVAKNIDGLEDKARAAEFELEMFGRTKSEIESVIIARLEEQHAMVSGWDSQEQLTSSLEKEIAARTKLRDAMRGSETMEAATKMSQSIAKEGEKAADQLRQSLIDNIMQGGKSAGELLQDYFRTLVLRPIIEGGVNAVFGGGGGAGGAGGLMNLGSMASSASSLLGLSGAGAGLMSGVSETLLGSSFVGPSATLAAGSTGIGASLGAALPWVGGALAVASLLGLFDDDGPKHERSIIHGASAASTYEDNTAYVDSVFGRYGYADAGTKYAGGAELSGSLAAVKSIDSELSAMLSLTEDEISAVSTRLASQSFSYMGENMSDQDAVSKLTGLHLKAILDSADIEDWQRGILESIDPLTASSEQLAAVFTQLGEAQSLRNYVATLSDFPDIVDSASTASMGLFATWQSGTDAIHTLADSFDGTLASAQTLGQAIQSRYATELQLVQQIQAAMASTSDMFTSSVRNVQLSVLDDAGKYSYYDAEAARYQDMLAVVTAPEMISDYASKLNDAIMSGWSLLDAEQQKAKADEYIALLERSDELAQERFLASQDAVVAERQQLAADIESAVDAAMQRAANAFVAAASIPPPPQQVDLKFEITGSGAGEVYLAPA